MTWDRARRLALWAFVIVLASLGGAIVHAAFVTPYDPQGGPIATFSACCAF